MRIIFLVLHFLSVIIIFSGCLEWFTSICNTSEKSEGGCNEYYSTQSSSNGISLIEMYEDGDKYKFTFDDSYAQEDDKLRIGFKNTKGDTLDGIFLTWGSQRMPPREVKNGELLTSIKKTLFTYKNKGVYSMCLKRNNDYDCNGINEVIVTIYIEKEGDCKASFIIDDKGINVYTDKYFKGSSKLVDPKHIGDGVNTHPFTLQKNEQFSGDTKGLNFQFYVDGKGTNSQTKYEKKESNSQFKGDIKEHNSQFNEEKKESNSQFKGDIKEHNSQFNEEKKESNSQINDEKKESNSRVKNREQTQENQKKCRLGEHSFQFSEEDEIESIMADERILKIFENDESIETRNQGEDCDGRLKHFGITVDTNDKNNKENENVESVENKDSFLEEIKDKIIYSDKKVSVSADIDPTFLSRLRSIVDSLQIYFVTEDDKVIDEHIFKSFSKGNIKSGDFIKHIKKTFLTDKNKNSFFMCPINMGGTRKCRIKIVQEGTGDFFYLTNADNKEQPHIFFY